MFDGSDLVQTLKQCGVTHVVWIPDSELGKWEPALRADPDIQLIRASREGEAIIIAAGLYLGGKRPVVMIQCTGMFEAGDALRNAVHDLKLPLFFIIGLRSYYAFQQKATTDTCPVFAEPILKAWQVPSHVLDKNSSVEELATAYKETRTNNRAGAVFIAG